MDQMGSPYAMAHGLGRPVEDASTQVTLEEDGVYKIWVRTRDWVGQWKGEHIGPAMRAVGSPGKFKLSFNGKQLSETFGVTGTDWHWQDGGTVQLSKGQLVVSLQDLTGFNGRCDAIYLTTDIDFTPPHELLALNKFRARLSGDVCATKEKGHYDFVVVGGGMAGTCAAISAARHGCTCGTVSRSSSIRGQQQFRSARWFVGFDSSETIYSTW